jgi:hypothetical protein
VIFGAVKNPAKQKHLFRSQSEEAAENLETPIKDLASSVTINPYSKLPYPSSANRPSQSFFVPSSIHYNTKMTPLTASWTKIADQDALRRSSHTISVIDDKAYIWGGELRPREPRDNDLYVIDLKDGKLPRSDAPNYYGCCNALFSDL